MKNLTARFNWHDSGWNGSICRDPIANEFCRDSHSLLSGRIEKRFNPSIESSIRSRPFYEGSSSDYYPPCYWTINAFGYGNHLVKDPHPFQGIQGRVGDYIKSTPPYETQLEPNSIYTWCFKLGFGQGDENYDPILEENTKNYLGQIKDGNSLVFMYSNYSNPVNGDDRKYLLLGVSVVSGTEMPSEYKIPDDDFAKLKAIPRFKYFPKLAWQFKVKLDSEKRVLLPYQKLVEWYEKGNNLEKEKRERVLDEISAPILKDALVPHFKYVSMHLGIDKSIYLLYELLKSIEKMKLHPEVVNYYEIENSEKTLKLLLEKEWKKRGRHPGFENLLHIYLPNDFNDTNRPVKIAIQYIMDTFCSIDDFVDKKPRSPDDNEILKTVFSKIYEQWDTFIFLSQFDFSINQFENVRQLTESVGLQEMKRNPYLIFEKYNFETKDDPKGNVDKSDYGIDVFQIDLALIPDLDYVNWPRLFKSDSPERLRALITEIMSENAEKGNTFLTRGDLLEELKNYPLFYTFKELEIGPVKLAKYEMQPMFREKFYIENREYQSGEVIYQILEYRKLENFIKKFFDVLLKKKHIVGKAEEELILQLTQMSKQNSEANAKQIERRSFFQKAFSNDFMVLSGKAGSGKTTAVANLIKKFLEIPKTPIFIFTPTGRSNLVIRDRIQKEINDVDQKKLTISTIHRFLFSHLLEELTSYRDRNGANYSTYKTLKGQISQTQSLFWDFLDGDVSAFEELLKITSDLRFKPKVVIVDESSMIDERLLGALLLMLDPEAIEHFILVGDEKQLPPIGPGRPFADIIAHLKRTNLEENYVRLMSNHRFNENAVIGQVSSLLEDDDTDPVTMAEMMLQGDESLDIRFFEDDISLKDTIRNIVNSVSGETSSDLSSTLANLFECGENICYDKLQILTAKRYGRFASSFINSRIVKNGKQKYGPRTKLICEVNQPISIETDNGYSKILGLANGSLGYIKGNGEVYFKELQELEKEYSNNASVMWQINDIKKKARENISELERDIVLGYAITVHKSQGSDFEHVIFVISESTRFLTRELFYTAITRLRVKLHVLIKSDLKANLSDLLRGVLENSEINRRKTRLYEQNEDLRKVYPMTLRNGITIFARSKIEKIIAISLDNMRLEFEYEPKELLLQHSIVPDFKISIDGKYYYIEHLGRMDNLAYRKRWFKKLEIYKNLGMIDSLITTSEEVETIDQEEAIKKLINDTKNGNLVNTDGGYSKHHYAL